MAELKTRPTQASVSAFIAGIEDEKRRKDCRAVLALMRSASGERPRMWGDSIVGFGQTHLHYASGREVDWFRIGFSPRKRDLTIYLMSGLDKHATLLKKLGEHRTGKGCLYVKKLEDLNLAALDRLIRAALRARSSP
jgi:hypothetical protein